MDLTSFEKSIKRTPIEIGNGGRKGDYEVWKTYEEAIELHKNKGYKRYFVTKRGGDYLSDKDLVIKLKDKEICVSNQWDISGINDFVLMMQQKGIQTK